MAWQKLDAIPEGDRARLWLFGVARNLLRRGARRRRIDAALVERVSTSLAAAQAAASLDDYVQHALAAALAELAERDHEILTLTAWEGLRPAEIAAVTGISANAVRIRLHRVRTRLARQLGARGSVRSCTPVEIE